MSNIANRIRFRREQLNISQKELSEMPGMQQNQLSRYERGLNTMNAELVEKFAHALGTTPNWILGFQGISLEEQQSLTAVEKAAIELIQSIPENKHSETLQLLRNIAKIVE